MVTRPLRKKRAGNILVLSALALVGMIAMLAFAIDVGYLCLAREELQRSADSAAIAAAWELIDEEAVHGVGNEATLATNVRSRAAEFAALNHVLRAKPELGDEDVSIGHLADPFNPQSLLDLSGYGTPNAVRVTVRRSKDQNGEVPFFFAKILGVDRMATRAEATATLVTSVSGFQTPADGTNLEILPFAIDEETWDGMLAGTGTDAWKWDPETDTARAGCDGILEVNLYPHGTGSPGNRGTVDIGSSNNSTCDISRQVVDGISPQDMEHHNHRLEFDEHGELGLNGDTGISAGVKDELSSIAGAKRIVPVFRSVVNPGNNAEYTIVKFVGIRIMSVQLTGAASKKSVMVQPANIVARGAIPSTGPATSQFVYSPVWLAR